MGFIDEFNISYNGEFHFATIGRGRRNPDAYTMTVSSAAVADASTLNLSCSPTLELQHDAILHIDREAPGFTVSNPAGYPQAVNRINVAQITGNAAIREGSRFRFDDPLHDQVYTLAEAVNPTATELRFVPSLRLSVSDGDVIKPLVECRVIVPDNPDGSVSDIIEVSAVPKQVRTTIISDAIAQNTTFEVFKMRKLLGLVNFSPSSEMATTPIFDHETQGQRFIGSYTTGASSKQLAITGNIRRKNRAYNELVLLVDDPLYDGLLCYAEAYHSNGQYSEGKGYFNNLSLTDQTPDATTFTTGFVYASGYVAFNIEEFDLYATPA